MKIVSRFWMRGWPRPVHETEETSSRSRILLQTEFSVPGADGRPQEVTANLSSVEFNHKDESVTFNWEINTP